MPGLIERIKIRFRKKQPAPPGKLPLKVSAFREFVEYNHIDKKINELKQKYRKAAPRSEKEAVKKAYKEVLASLFSTDAVSYREQIIPKGQPVMGMSVGCIRMVDSVT